MSYERSERKNRLAGESSPYLRQHAENPVDWYPWGDEALAAAREQDKPILLSVGYSACHWCHVMAHESFEDAKTAQLMNERFINIKVDREERPDLDQLYQGVVQLMGRGGGWPLTVFLRPDLKPFFGGTYFPKEARYGMPAFSEVLLALDEAYHQRKDQVEEQASEFGQALEALSRHGLGGEKGELKTSDVRAAGEGLAREVDPAHGGFGGAPKFPNPMCVALLFRAWRRGAAPSVRDAALLTLEKMALGGIYDQLGGGFHRYSVDAQWRVPHFEKMLYDNAQLLHLYSEAQQIDPRPLWEKVVRETVGYIVREMTAPSGGFYASQDADSEGEEGKFFAWTLAQVREVLGEQESGRVERHFGLTAEGNFEHGKSVLEVKDPLGAEALAPSLRKLWTAREKRVKPGLDDKILAGWNGLLIRGLAFASRVFAEAKWALVARRAADFLLAELWDGRDLKRVYQGGAAKIDAFVEDYGDLASGLAALFQATQEPKYLGAAHSLATRAVELFWDAEQEAYRTARLGQRDLFCAPYALHDNAAPSGASTLTEAQVALAALTGKHEPLEHAQRYVAKLAPQMKRNPFAFGHLWLAADALLDGAAEVTLVGKGEELPNWLGELRRVYSPTAAWLIHDAGQEPSSLVAPTLEGRTARGGVTAYLCHHASCGAPATKPEELRAQLSALGG
jgi:uncharacterized protein YyaL (SSP411 family)